MLSSHTYSYETMRLWIKFDNLFVFPIEIIIKQSWMGHQTEPKNKLLVLWIGSFSPDFFLRNIIICWLYIFTKQAHTHKMALTHSLIQYCFLSSSQVEWSDPPATTPRRLSPVRRRRQPPHQNHRRHSPTSLLVCASLSPFSLPLFHLWRVSKFLVLPLIFLLL